MFRATYLMAIALVCAAGRSAAADFQPQIRWAHESGGIYYCLNGASGKDMPCDGPFLVYSVGMSLQQSLTTDHFDYLERGIAALDRPGSVLTDGSWTSDSVEAGLREEFMDWKMWPQYDAHLTAWRHQVPDSVAAGLVEAIVCLEHGRVVETPEAGRGLDPAAPQQALALYRRASEALERIRNQRDSHPLWYRLEIETQIALGAAPDRIEATYAEGAERFPGYPGLMLAFGALHLPTAGASEADYVRFAERMAKDAGKGTDKSTGKSTGNGAGASPDPAAYARLAAAYDAAVVGAPIRLASYEAFQWPELKRALADWQVRYPRSLYVSNLTASYACRAGDFSTYRSARHAFGIHVVEEAWVTGYSREECDLRAGVDPDEP